ncbi:MAG: hypothetical protein AAGJ81_14675 [Verrucomicrobiota bacterium]
MSRNAQTKEEQLLARKLTDLSEATNTLEARRRATLYQALEYQNRRHSLLRVLIPTFAILAVALLAFWSLRLPPDQPVRQTSLWTSSTNWVTGNEFSDSRDAIAAKLSGGSSPVPGLLWQDSPSSFEEVRQRTVLLRRQVQPN